MSSTDHLKVSYLIKREGIQPHKQAIVFEGKSLTYQELHDRSLKFANYLYDSGIRKGDRVVILLKNCLEFWEMNFGIYETGAIVVPLNSRLAPQEVSYLIEHCKPKVILYAKDHAEHIRLTVEKYHGAKLVYLGNDEPEIPGSVPYESILSASDTAPLDVPLHPDDPAEIIYTSGTTGFPKGAVWTHGTVLWNSIQQCMDYGISSDDSVYVISGLNYIAGRHDFTMSVFHQGGTVHIRRTGDFEINEVIEYIKAHRITLVLLMPLMIHDLHREGRNVEENLKSLRMIMCGGAPVPVTYIEKTMKTCPQADFIQVYGSTEVGGTVTALKKEDSIRKIGSCGKPTIHNLVSLVDKNGNPVKPGETGEIIVKGPSVIRGYWDNPEATGAAMKDGWFYTGDLGKFDDEQFLYIVGRKKDMIISGGMNIYPEEIEVTLRSHPDVKDCAIIGIPDERWGESILPLFN